jgi:hypothetical protein
MTNEDEELPSPDDAGPFDVFSERDRLDARVTRSAGGRVEVHGFDFADDLARHYSFGEVALTMLSGVPPSEEVGELFALCCVFAIPASVAEAPAHVARLSQTIGTDAPGTVAAVTTAIAEQIQFHIARLEPYLEWLEAPDEAVPEVALEDEDALEGLADAFSTRLSELDVEMPMPIRNCGFWAQLFAALHVCGLKTPRQIIAALVMARLPGAIAEGLGETMGELSDYPLNIPGLRYRHEEARDG